MPEKNEILENTTLADKVNRFRVYAPEIVKRRQAGQFVIIRIDQDGERVPLTIADTDPDTGSLVLVVQAVGKSTTHMATLQPGFVLADLVGPLGSPTHIEKVGTVVMVGGGIGIAPAHPIAQAMKAAGNRVVSILGARTKDLLIMEEEMKAASDEVLVCTDDGSYGRHGLVTDALKDLIAEQGKPDLAVAIGPPIMMKFVSLLTKEHEIPTVASVNPIMIDGTGMCGGCRITVGGKVRFGCVDGPEFDAHQIDFDEMMQRQAFYKEQEQLALDRYEHKCKLGRK